MVIKINGSHIDQFSLSDKIRQEAEMAKTKIEKESNREFRRSKYYKSIIGLITFMGIIGTASVAKAESVGESTATFSSASTSDTPIGGIWHFIASKIENKINGPTTINQEDSGMWHLNNYITNTLFQTQDFFSDPTILGIFHTIWAIALSFTTLMIGKKGYDMVKAKVLGAQSQGAVEFVIRLLASGLMSFLSLPLIGLGIKLSNATASVFMKNISNGYMVFGNALQAAEGGFGAALWLVGFVVMFVLLGVTYWSRQINLAIMGCMTPVASMAWVTDGGSMLSTLIKEIIVILTTPLIQTLILGISSAIMVKVATTGAFSFLSTILIGLSSMCLMFITPGFLRKFVAGSFNPLQASLDIFLKIKAMPLQLLRFMK